LLPGRCVTRLRRSEPRSRLRDFVFAVMCTPLL
jgi:hypothetical protein